MGPMHTDGMFVLGGVFNSSTNFKARLQMIDRIVARMIPDVALLSEWNAISNRALVLYKRRNLMAHGMVWGGSNGHAYFIKYSFWNDSNRKKMTFQQACAQQPSFRQFAERVTNLAIALNKWLAEHPRPPSTRGA